MTPAMAAAPELVFERHNGIALIRLNRPDQLNAFTPGMIADWQGALEDCIRDAAVKVVITTGTGRAFCSGGDVKSLQHRGGETAYDRKTWLWEHVQRIPILMQQIDKPTIAAINGLAVGAGLDLALSSDLRIAASSARFAETYARMGIVPGAGGAWLLPRLVGDSRALEMLWFGEWVSADDARTMGLVNAVVPDEALMSHVMVLAERLAAGPAVALRMIKRLVRASHGMDLAAHLDMASSHMGVAAATSDHREAVAAKAEKREPRFVGR